MKKVFFLIAALTLAIGFGTTPAAADSFCAAGSTCTVLLTQTNTTQLAGIVITVTIDNTGSNTILSFQVTSSPVSNPPNGIDQIGWNAGLIQTGTRPNGNLIFGINPIYASTSSTNFDGHQAGSANGTMDGFGQFNIQAADPAGTGGFSMPITFTLAGLVTNFPANGSGNEFAVHVRYQNNCSGFVGGQTGTTSSSDASGCTVSVPEPGSLALLGVGLFGLVAVARRRWIA